MTLLIRGYASIFGNTDAMGEVVDSGAFTAWIRENPAKDLPLFWAHDHKYDPTRTPIGKTTLLREDSRGLYFEAEILDTNKGKEIQKLVEAGAVEGSSFAYFTHDAYVGPDGLDHLAELEPRELTVCTWGANPEAFTETIPEPIAEE